MNDPIAFTIMDKDKYKDDLSGVVNLTMKDLCKEYETDRYYEVKHPKHKEAGQLHLITRYTP